MADRPGLAKTCPASRHCDLIVDSLRRKRSPMRKVLIDSGFDPDHLAGSIDVVVRDLWHARQWLKWEQLPPEPGQLANGHWVPDLEAIKRYTDEAAQ